MPVGAVNEPPAIAHFVAILTGYDADFATLGMLRELRARNRQAKNTHGLTEGHRRKVLVADAHDEIRNESIAQLRSRRLIERRIEIETADRRRQRLCQSFATQSDAGTPRPALMDAGQKVTSAANLWQSRPATPGLVSRRLCAASPAARLTSPPRYHARERARQPGVLGVYWLPPMARAVALAPHGKKAPPWSGRERRRPRSLRLAAPAALEGR